MTTAERQAWWAKHAPRPTGPRASHHIDLAAEMRRQVKAEKAARRAQRQAEVKTMTAAARPNRKAARKAAARRKKR